MLNLHDTPLNFTSWHSFPRTLTHIASNKELSLLSIKDPGPMGMNFKHLNIPYWRLLWSDALADSLDSEMEVLKIGLITGIDDGGIPTFFSKFATETLRNTSIHCLNYVQTGQLIAHYDGIIKDYTIETMEALALPLVNDALKPFLAVGASISASPLPRRHSSDLVYMVIPTRPEIETIHLLDVKMWCPVDTTPYSNGKRPVLQPTSRPIFAFQSDNLKELVLESSLLVDCAFPASWPSSLVRIGLDARLMNDFRFVAFPPSLEVLSLRSSNGKDYYNSKSPIIGVLPFSLESLPTSLKRLTIQSLELWSPQPTQPLSTGIRRFSLPPNFVSPYNLTMARFQGILHESLEYVFNALLLANATVEFKEDDFHLGVKKLALNHKNVVISAKSRWTHLN